MKSPHKQYLSIIAVLIVIIVLLRECNGGGGEECPEIGKTIVQIDTITIPGDSIPYPVATKVPVPYRVVDTVEIPLDVDTFGILADYFREYIYTDTITDDSTFLFIIDDVVSQNRIQDRKAQFQQLSRQIIRETITNFVSDEKTKIYVGGYVGGNQSEFDAGPELMLQTKKDHVYGIQWSPIYKRYYVKTFFKISFKKKGND